MRSGRSNDLSGSPRGQGVTGGRGSGRDGRPWNSTSGCGRGRLQPAFPAGSSPSGMGRPSDRLTTRERRSGEAPQGGTSGPQDGMPGVGEPFRTSTPRRARLPRSPSPPSVEATRRERWDPVDSTSPSRDRSGGEDPDLSLPGATRWKHRSGSTKSQSQYRLTFRTAVQGTQAGVPNDRDRPPGWMAECPRPGFPRRGQETTEVRGSVARTWEQAGEPRPIHDLVPSAGDAPANVTFVAGGEFGRGKVVFVGVAAIRESTGRREVSIHRSTSAHSAQRVVMRISLY
jgi:hypothetical protein